MLIILGATPNKKAMPIKKSHDEGENEVTTPTSSGPKTGETNTRKLAQKAFLHALQTRYTCATHVMIIHVHVYCVLDLK